MIEATAFYSVDAFTRTPSTRPTPLTIGLAYDFPDDLGDSVVCERLWALLNADDRPNRYQQRSLSVGDIVRVISYPDGRSHPARRVRWYRAEIVGFAPVRRPALFAGADDAYFALAPQLGEGARDRRFVA